MENSMRLGLMTVFAVSGSMVLLVHQVHKHLFNNFMEKFECEIRPGGHHPKSLNGCSTKHQTKKVRFAERCMEIKGDVARTEQDARRGHELKGMMPPNREVLYRGIMKYRALKGTLDF